MVSLGEISGVNSTSLAYFGLDWSNVVPTLYNLIPYSFLLDYFSNLGSLIEAACTPTSSLMWKYRAFRSSTREVLEPLDSVFLTQGYFSETRRVSKPGRSAIESLVLRREPWVLEPIPPLVFKIPGFSTKWINMAALAGQNSSVRSSLRL